MTIKSKVKRIKSLQLKKYRQEEQCFVVEGWKGVEALLKSDFKLVLVASTQSYLQRVESLLEDSKQGLSEGLHLVTGNLLERMGGFQSNESVLAVAQMKKPKSIEFGKGLILALDDIRDPGNLGTIIRTGDWFGVKSIVASENSVDFYNPKVIHATMGSFCNVEMSYHSLPDLLRGVTWPVYGAFLDGHSIRSTNIDPNGILVIGNESNGISPEVAQYVKHRITIPGLGHAESLNASVAAGILLYAATGR